MSLFMVAPCVWVWSWFDMSSFCFQTSRLYYENTTGIYYYYDEQSGTYKLHSRVDISSSKQKTVRKDSTDEKESGEESSEDEAESDKEVEGIGLFYHAEINDLSLSLQAEWKNLSPSNPVSNQCPALRHLRTKHFSVNQGFSNVPKH